MRRLLVVLGALAAIGAAASGGYIVGQRRVMDAPSNTMRASAPPAPQRERRVAYYQHPDGLDDFSPTPRSDDRGRPYVPVYEEDEPAAAPAPSPPPAAQGRGRILYYRNPMGLPDTSPVPRKDSMGMDYIPVYENEADDGTTVRVSLDRIQRIGVRTEPVARRSLTRTIRAVGSIQFDERLQAVVSPRFEGWVVRVHAGVTGQPVGQGNPLVDVYSPELLQAVREYRLAAGATHGGRGDDFLGRLLAGARQRLQVFGLPEADIMALARSEPANGAITLRAPIAGIVAERRAVEGMRFAAGDMLYRVADAATVWLVAEVFEQDIAQVAVGQETQVTVAAYPGRSFTGRVAFIYPMVSRETRTTRVRIDLANADGALRADMYGNVEIRAAAGQADALVVPDSAILDTGTRQIVLVDRGDGRFEPRPVQLGARADGLVEVREGLQPDERVVVSANFLIDAESNLRAALRAFTQDGSQR